MSVNWGAGPLILVSLLGSDPVLAEGPAYRLRADQGPSPHVPSDIRLLTAVGDRLFFAGTDPTNGTELWTSDGTAGGTHLVRDIFPGPDIVIGTAGDDGRLNPTPGPLVALNDALLFAASDDNWRCVLWRSDGSGVDTFPVVDPGRADVPVLGCMPLLGHGPPPIMPVSGGRMFFGAYQGIPGPFGLWSTDGTEAGTRYLAPLVAPQGGQARLQAADASGILAFQDFDSIHGYGLWRSDGTPEGTRFVTSLGGPLSTLGAMGRSVLVEVDPPGSSTSQVSIVDLDGARSTLLRTISWPSSDPHSGPGLTGIARAKGALVFSVVTGGGDDGVWRTDGTSGGTARLLVASRVSGLAVAGDVVIGASAAGLFRTDGTPAGTFGLLQADFTSDPPRLTSVGNRVWFSAGYSIWASDGSLAGTILVSSATIGTGFVAVGTHVFFTAYSILWSTDGTVRGTESLFPDTPSHVAPDSTLLAVSGRGAFFRSFPDLWLSDGRPEGAVRVASITSGPLRAAMFHGKLIFMTDGSDTELWQSDGTPAGTSRLLAQPLLSGFSFTFTEFAQTGDALVLIEQGFLGNVRIWRTDGSPGGTTVAQLAIFGALDSVSSLSHAGNRLVFPFRPSVYSGDVQLFSTDGTLAGTIPFATVGSYSSPVTSGGTLFFVGSGSMPSTKALWRTDGTAAGTASLVRATSIDSLVAGPNGSVYFLVPGSNGPSLFRSDGTEAGTTALIDLPKGARLFLSSGEVVFFTAADPATGSELWRTDGTEAGTSLVRDIVPGGLGSNPDFLVSIGRVHVFAATDGEHGNELWRTDGTTEGTWMIQDIVPGPGSSSPRDFVEACGGLVYFTAEVDGVGREPFAIPLSAIDPGAVPKPCPVTLAPTQPTPGRHVRP
jgi:ELWxxDGT repeat protein